jgi:hypothetical protein
VQGKVTAGYLWSLPLHQGEANEALEAISRSETGATLVTLALVTSGLGRRASRDHITDGTLMPMTASTRVNSRRTTATVASRNFLRPWSASLRMGWRW